MEPNLERAFDLALRLMAIPGKSGEEAAVAAFIKERLVEAGADPSAFQTDTANRHTPLAGDTGNLIYKMPGTRKAPRRMLSAHMDTVPLCVGSKPLRQEGQVVSGVPGLALGADDRAGVAAILSAAIEILERKLPHPPLTFLFPIQEEIGLQGARLVDKSLLGEPKLAFNWDGSSPHKATIGATGGYRMQIEVRGVASHAGVAPERGVSAIAIASLAIADLHRGGWHGLVLKDGKRGTSNVGIINGGQATNVVTDQVSVRVEARSHDREFRQEIVRQIEAAFQRAAAEVGSSEGQTGSVTIDGRLDYEAFLLKKDEPCVQAAVAAIRKLGRDPELSIANGGLDANWLAQHGIPTVTLGCGQRNPHMSSEALEISEFHDACRLALWLALGVEEETEREKGR